MISLHYSERRHVLEAKSQNWLVSEKIIIIVLPVVSFLKIHFLTVFFKIDIIVHYAYVRITDQWGESQSSSESRQCASQQGFVSCF